MKKWSLIFTLAIFVKLLGVSGKVIEFPNCNNFYVQGDWIMIQKKDIFIAAVFNRSQIQWVSETNLDYGN